MNIVPEQRKGAKSVTKYSIKLSSASSAKKLFDNARKNLLNINNWHIIAGPDSAVFEVINSKGKRTNDIVKKGNYLRITIPNVPDSPAGDGADWVKVEDVDEQENNNHQFIAISVRPAPDPGRSEHEVAHFFAPGATSTFSIERNNRMVIAAVNGRNETPNTKTKTIRAWIRNFFVALGAMMGFNKPQWKSLVKGLIKKRL